MPLITSFSIISCLVSATVRVTFLNGLTPALFSASLRAAAGLVKSASIDPICPHFSQKKLFWIELDADSFSDSKSAFTSRLDKSAFTTFALVTDSPSISAQDLNVSSVFRSKL